MQSRRPQSLSTDFRQRLLWIFGLTVVYVVVYLNLYPDVGEDLLVLATIPVGLAGWLFGLRAGTGAALLSLPVNAFLLAHLGLPVATTLFRESLPDVLLVVGSGPVAGWLNRLVARVRRQSWDLARERERLEQQVQERRRAEESVQESEQRFRTMFDYAGTGLALVGRDGRVLKVNRSLCEMLGYKEEELLNGNCDALTHPESAEASARYRRDLLVGKAPSYQVEKRYVHRLGYTIWAQTRASAVVDGEGRPLYLILEIQDISERKQFEAQLVHLANHDPLTELTNRRRFQEDLGHYLALARRGDTQGALIFLDLDDFKDVNDSLGHGAGDQVLRTMARTMRLSLRESDILARVGGDEFAVLLPQVDAAQAEAAAARILQAIAGAAVNVAGHPVHIGASMGVTLFPEHGATAEELFACADLAMYQAKSDGGNRWMLYSSDREWEAQIASRRTWEYRIREALEKERFVLAAQPILDLRSGRVARYELLLRMRDERGGLIPPADFLEIAERFGLIREIDSWVVRRAIRIAAEVQRLQKGVCLEANLSGKSLNDEDLLPLVREELAKFSLDPHCLVLEITETAAVADLERARAFIGALKELGFGFALDDFGVGFRPSTG